MLAIQPHAWTQIREQVAELLDVAELGGVEAAIGRLNSPGLEWIIPPTA